MNQLEKNIEEPQINSDQELLDLAYADPAVFSKWPLGYDSPEHQADWLDLAYKYPWLLIEAPTAHGKTTTFIRYLIWRVVRNRNIRIGLISNNDVNAKADLSEIKSHMEGNKDLIDNFGGDFKGKKWKEGDIVVNGSTIAKKDSTIFTIGVGGHLFNRRFDLLLLDDTMDMKNCMFPQRRAKLIEWFHKECLSRLEPWGEIVIIGSPQHRGDLYDALKNDDRFKCFTFRAIIDDPSKKVLWPEHWSYERLMYTRGNTPSSIRAFEVTKQCKLSSETESLIARESIESNLHEDKPFLITVDDKARAEYKYIITAVDPAASMKRKACYFVIMTLGVIPVVNHENRYTGKYIIDILDIVRDHIPTVKQEPMIIKKMIDLKSNVCFVETNSYQIALENNLKKHNKKIIGLYTGEDKNRLDIGVPSLFLRFEENEIIIRAGCDRSRGLAAEFVNEIMDYPDGDTDDMLMAYFIGMKGIFTFLVRPIVAPNVKVQGHKYEIGGHKYGIKLRNDRRIVSKIARLLQSEKRDIQHSQVRLRTR